MPHFKEGLKCKAKGPRVSLAQRHKNSSAQDLSKIGFLGMQSASEGPMLRDRVRQIIRDQTVAKVRARQNARPKPKRTNTAQNSCFPEHKHRRAPEQHMFEGSAVIARLREQGLINQAQIEGRMNHLIGSAAGSKRPHESTPGGDPPDHKSKQFKSKSFCDSSGPCISNSGSLPYRKRKRGDQDDSFEQIE